MASEKLYTMAGVSTLNHETKVRFTSRHAYLDTLQEAGHKNIIITELPEPMNRIDAANFLKNHTRFQDDEAQNAIDEYIAKQTEKETTGSKTSSRRGNSDDMAERIANRVVELLFGASDDSRQKLIERLRAATALLDEEEVDMID